MTTTSASSKNTSTPTATTTNSPTAHTSTPSKTTGGGDGSDKVVLGVVLSLVGAIIIGAVVAVIIFCLWKKKYCLCYKKSQEPVRYEPVPTM